MEHFYPLVMFVVGMSMMAALVAIPLLLATKMTGVIAKSIKKTFDALR